MYKYFLSVQVKLLVFLCAAEEKLAWLAAHRENITSSPRNNGESDGGLGGGGWGGEEGHLCVELFLTFNNVFNQLAFFRYVYDVQQQLILTRCP